MNRARIFAPAFAAAACLLSVATESPAQVFAFDRDTLIKFTAKNPFERFPDGRPKVPDSLLERARGLSAEEVWGILPRRGFPNQYEDGFQILQPGKRMVGRAVTVQFMPMRGDVSNVMNEEAKAKGLGRLGNQTIIDMLQPGDILVADIFGKVEGGTMVGDNLFYYIMKATKGAGLVVDGAIRDLQGIADMDMPAYFRGVHPSAIAQVMVTGINVPIRIGKATVMPGDVVFGDREGIYFIPPEVIQEVVDRADETHIHDEWTKMKFDTGKYKSSEIYGSPRDPELKKEYQEYLKKRMAELKASRGQK